MSTLHELGQDYVTCRVRRHRFEDVPDKGGVGRRLFKDSGSIERLCARCERCGTIRYEAWSRVTGERLFSHYVYPKGYSTAGEGLKPIDFRVEYIRRQQKRRKKAA
jgi:hypothetical protein